MTEDERRDRNPKPEIATMRPGDHPEVKHPSELERPHVYVLIGRRIAATLNYLGTVNTMDPQTLDVMVCYHFQGPRVGLDVYLRWRNGSFEDGTGKIVVRKYTGSDAV